MPLVPDGATPRPRRARATTLALLAAFATGLLLPLGAVDAAFAFCTSSIDPKCAGANLPILVEAGVVSLGATTVAAPAAVAAGPAVAPLAITGGVGLIATIGGVLGAVMGFGGVEAQPTTVDEDYEGFQPETGVCVPSLPAVPSLTDVPTCNVATIYANVSGVKTANGVYNVGVTSAPSGTTNQSVTVTFARQGGYSNGGTQSFGGLWKHCRDRATGAVSSSGIFLVLGPQPTNYTGTYTFACPNASDWVVFYTSTSAAGALNPPYAVIASRGTGTYTPSTGEYISGDVRTIVKCRPYSGGPDYYVQTVESFVIDVDGAVPIPGALCTTGDMALETVTSWLPTGSSSWEVLVESADLPAEQQDWFTAFPNCFGLTPEPCALTLWKVNPEGFEESCGPTGLLCVGWADTPATEVEARYKCKYGEYDVDLQKCSVYRNPTQGVLPNTKPDGSPIPITAPSPTTPLNPLTPEQAAEVGIDYDTIIDTEGTGECWPTGWGVLNPFSWVFLPIGCALEAAFVPRTEVVSETLTQLETALDTKMPGQLVSIFGEFDLPSVPTGCSGITVSVFFLGPPFQIMQACPGDMLRPLADLSRLFGNITFTVYGVVAITRHVARIFAFGGLGDS